MRKIFEHTADAGIKVESNTLNEAFNELSLSFTEIVTGGNLTTKQKSYEVNLVSEDLDSLLVRFVSHLIFLFDTKNFLPASAEVDIVISESCEINGQLLGDSYDQEKHGYGVEVKAVSYHMLEISVGPPSTIVIILDL